MWARTDAAARNAYLHKYTIVHVITTMGYVDLKKSWTRAANGCHVLL